MIALPTLGSRVSPVDCERSEANCERDIRRVWADRSSSWRFIVTAQAVIMNRSGLLTPMELLLKKMNAAARSNHPLCRVGLPQV